jgi:hypothetical protein
VPPETCRDLAANGVKSVSFPRSYIILRRGHLNVMILATSERLVTISLIYLLYFMNQILICSLPLPENALYLNCKL